MGGSDGCTLGLGAGVTKSSSNVSIGSNLLDRLIWGRSIAVPELYTLILRLFWLCWPAQNELLPRYLPNARLRPNVAAPGRKNDPSDRRAMRRNRTGAASVTPTSAAGFRRRGRGPPSM